MSETKLPFEALPPIVFENEFQGEWDEPRVQISVASYYLSRGNGKWDDYRAIVNAVKERIRPVITSQPKDSAPKLSKAQRDAIHEWLDFSFQHPSDEALDAATESLASAIEGASATEQALHPALQQLYERYDLAMKRVRESGLDKRPYWSGEATGLEIAINLLGGTTDDR